jgi:hypothetical protein
LIAPFALCGFGAFLFMTWIVAIPLLSGIAIVVGGFLAVMAVYTFIAQGLRALR